MGGLMHGEGRHALTDRALADALSKRVRGEVGFDDGTRALYATDASNYRQVPLGVVHPCDVDDTLAALEVCRAFGAPIVGRGGGTSLAGQACNAAVVLDFSRHVHRILEIDPERRFARIEPGTVLDTLRARAEEFHLTFGPDPATHTHCTLGGMIGNNSCGVHSMMAGCTAENVEELDVVTYDGLRLTLGATSREDLQAAIRAGGRRGEIFRRVAEFRDRHGEAIRRGFPHLPRRVSGYNLPALLSANGHDDGGVHLARALVGSEGTLATVLSARVRLVPSPPARVLLVLGYPSVFEAADHIGEIRESAPIGLEGIDRVLVEDIREKELHPGRLDLLPEGEGWLLVEFGGQDHDEARDHAERLISRLRLDAHAPSHRLFVDRSEQEVVWKVRESGLGATARVPGRHDTWEGWEDASVPPDQLGRYLRRFREQLSRYGYRAALYGHFGQGCVHTRIPFDLKHPDGVATFRAFVEEAADLVVEHGGSLSGEHGDGQSRAELLPKMFPAELLRAFDEWKAIWDPQGRMNPGKVVRARRLDDDLRLGPGYDPRSARTTFRFPDDHGSFSYATERCVGVGKCRREDAGTMCPSYMATREERHSTRGRAHLLFEMLRGETIRDGWRSRAVHDALELCLSCKGCKGECPVNVDLATYKAEFLSHYYEGRLRPRTAFTFGLIYWWARLSAPISGLVNLLHRSPVTGSIVKWVLGVEPKRSLPELAPVTFREWWRGRPKRGKDWPGVILWVDTWSNHFEPAVAVAAVDALEAAGFRVIVPQASLCCGRPLYDWGMLGLARHLLRRTMDELGPALGDGLPVVGLEPSCISVFRDELPGLFPDDEQARALASRSFLLGDFLTHHVDGWTPPRLERKAVVHGHCHHTSVLDFSEDASIYRRMGLDAEILDSGCCGMAGAFGFERGERYDVSVACAERVLAPSVREAETHTIVIADGFSCREQIRQQTPRRALHTAQVLQMARLAGPSGPATSPPELDYTDTTLQPPRGRMVRRLALLAVAAAGLLVFSRRVAPLPIDLGLSRSLRMAASRRV